MDASPGEPVDYADVHAVELYQQIQRHGWSMVAALVPLPESAAAREALFIRLDWLTQHYPAMLAQWQGSAPTSSQEAPTYDQNRYG